MAREEEQVKAFARRLLPVNHGSWVVERALISLEAGIARLGDKERSSLDPDELWGDAQDRGRGRHAHGFTFFADWVGASPHVDADQATLINERVLQVVDAWVERFGSDRASAPEMAYHDETTAQRLLGIVAAIDILDLEAGRRDRLVEFAATTAEILLDPDFHSGLNNHGMFQDLALLTWSILVADAPDDADGQEAWESAERRLDAYFDSCFTAEGVHVENTPTYHVMVSRYLPILAGIYERAGSPSAELYAHLLEGAKRYAIHCAAPDGLYPPVSDTQRRRLDTDRNLETFPGGEFEYAVTSGETGAMPAERTSVFPRSGYAMTRSAWGDRNATFVYFACAYNADYHKHSDEQSIYVASGGRPLLCEAGPYGYNWKDPFTSYAYSSAAHNTLLIDGSGLPRTEPLEVRNGPRKPLDEVTVDVALDDLLDATGTTRRFDGRTWTRHLRVTHGKGPTDSRILIRDDVRSDVGAANLQFLWHVGPGLTVVPHARGAEVFDGPTKVMELDLTTTADIVLDVVEGDETGQKQGWYFPSFGEKTTAPVLTVDCWQQNVVIETEVRLSGFLWGDDGRESLTPLLDHGPAIPAWVFEDPSAGERAVVVLGYSTAPEGRDRITAELQKSGLKHWYVPGISQEMLSGVAPDRGVHILREVADAVAGLVRSCTAQGIDVRIATVGEAFVPGTLAAATTGAPVIGLNPRLPFAEGDVRAARLTAHLSDGARGGSIRRSEMLVTGDVLADAERALRIFDRTEFAVYKLPSMLAADAEDGFSDVLRNALEHDCGREIRYFVGYDRRSGRFVIELPDHSDVSVAVRVFHGKEETAALPYTPGKSHALPYRGHGPHRLRIHVRDQQGEEIAAFTTGTIRVR